MSKEVFTQVIRGAHAWVGQAEEALEKALAEHGAERAGRLGAADVLLPADVLRADGAGGESSATCGRRSSTPANCCGRCPTDELWLPYLGDGLDAGAATMLATEALVALRTVNGYQTPAGWQGFISDTIMRELGIQLVDGRMPGFALILGPAPTTEIAVKTVRELQKRSILTFLCANRDGQHRAASRWSRAACSRTTPR